MHVGLLQIEFFLSGCRSLKEKRQRLGGIREKYGRITNVAVSESAHHDTHQRAQWSFVATAASADVVERTLGEIERSLQMSVDAQLVSAEREWL